MMYRLDLATIPNLFPRLTGDYNGDGAVDAADYIVWRKTFGSNTVLHADGSRSGTIDDIDYDLWVRSFGVLNPPSSPTQFVPEPSTWLLVSGGGCLLGVILSRSGRCFKPRFGRSAGLIAAPPVD